MLKWISEINSLASFPDVEVIVEGSRDEAALRALGAQATFVHASDLLRELREKGGDRVRGKTFVIMTDFDGEGLMLHKRLRRIITEMGGKVEDSLRRDYRSLGLPPLIEEVKGFIERRVPDWSLLTGDWRSV